MPHATASIIAHIHGGLGNQLFCYAAARNLALRAELPLKLNTTTGYRKEKYQRQCLLEQFNIRANEAGAWEAYRGPLGRTRRSMQIKRDAKQPIDMRLIIKEPSNQAFISELLELKPRQSVYLLGHWQDERYFVEARQTLRTELMLPADAPFDADPQLDALTQQPHAVSVHLRSYAEVKDPPAGLVLDASYYSAALDAIKQQQPDAHFIAFSDNRDWAQQIIEQSNHLEHTTFAEPASADPTTATLTDFQLMTRCQHHVVGNSSFSWWTAWLGERDDSHIIAPPTGLPGHGRGFPPRWLGG
ncbi:MAG: alpha-1,2-fucosyltransferase [Phycisphaeraceae bacterium]